MNETNETVARDDAAAETPANGASATPATTAPPTGPSGDTVVAATPPRHQLPAAIRVLRPRQWLKNVFVLAAPLAAGTLFHTGVLWRTLLAVVAFIAVSAAIYVVNDVRDAEDDRRHPVKRLRPIAAGEIRPVTALVIGACCALAGFALGFFLDTDFGAILVFYVLLQISYSLWLKDRPIIDLAVVTIGFLLRAISGGVATGLLLSQWFLLVAGFGSLFMVAGKRYSELVTLGSAAKTRPSLAGYTPTFLRFIWGMSAALVVSSYALWAFDQHHDDTWLGIPWAIVSIAPFALVIISYARVIDAGKAGEPEDAVLGDVTLLAMACLWLVCVALAIFAT
ncbi:MAG: decaprenyl-phosphate phosphoribosyltransferase [Propionibacteriaceae bacterium]|nr:decaprenyl-phosphate phosphoribosyltransferase [Propionibacteriaceae bacterium]